MLSPVLISSFDVEDASVEAFASYTITYGENDVAVITVVIFFAKHVLSSCILPYFRKYYFIHSIFIPLYFSVNKYIYIFNDTYQLDIFNLAELTDMPIQYTNPPSASYQPMGD